MVDSCHECLGTGEVLASSNNDMMACPVCTELFRVNVTNQNQETIETTEPTIYYSEAHLMILNHYDSFYPEKIGVVQHSTDGGKTWNEYDSHQKVNGTPKWVHHQKIWRELHD